MSAVTCFDAVKLVTDEATARFAPLFCESRGKTENLKQSCGALDALAEEFDATSFEVDVDETRMTISVTMECPEILIQQKNHLFYSLAARALSVRFCATTDDALAVCFVFPGIWERSV